MTDLPLELDDAQAGFTYHGRPVITVRSNATFTSFGEIFPIEPPVEIPAGGKVIMDDLTDAPFVSYYASFGVYVEGRRTAHYRFVDGRFGLIV